MPMNLEQKQRTASATIDQELSIYCVNEYRDTLAPLLGGLDELHIDLSRVTELDSAGLQWLMALKQLQPAVRVSFEHHSRAVTDVLDLLDLLAGFQDPVLLEAGARP